MKQTKFVSIDKQEGKQFKAGYKIGWSDAKARFLELINDLNKKYPSQTYGQVGIKWNKELNLTLTKTK